MAPDGDITPEEALRAFVDAFLWATAVSWQGAIESTVRDAIDRWPGCTIELRRFSGGLQVIAREAASA